VLYVLGVSLLPIPLNETVIQNMIETDTRAKHNFVPFKDIYNTFLIADVRVILTQLFSHVLLFVPLGFYAPWFRSIFKKLKSIIILGALFSIQISLMHFCISALIGVTYKSFVLDHILLNTIGTVFGFVLYKISHTSLNKLIISIDQPLHYTNLINNRR